MEQQPAIPVWITELLSGSYAQHEDSPTTVTLQNGTTIQKARICGVAVSRDELVVDDGTGSILVRAFETPANVAVGDPILVIGKPRIYQGQPYLLGDIVKKINPKWLEVHKLSRPQENTKEKTLEMVKTLDHGDGADYNEVIAKLGTKGEEIIVHMLANGDLFETRPGRLKVLE